MRTGSSSATGAANFRTLTPVPFRMQFPRDRDWPDSEKRTDILIFVAPDRGASNLWHKTVPTFTVMSGHLQICSQVIARHLSDLAAVNENGHIHHFVRLSIIRRPPLNQLMGNCVQMSM